MVASRKLSDSHRSDQYRETGAVGTLAVQFAKRLRARVIATASAFAGLATRVSSSPNKLFANGICYQSTRTPQNCAPGSGDTKMKNMLRLICSRQGDSRALIDRNAQRVWTPQARLDRARPARLEASRWQQALSSSCSDGGSAISAMSLVQSKRTRRLA